MTGAHVLAAKTLVAGTVVVASLCLSSVAKAGEARTSSLSWLRMPGADACIATQALARAVEERLGRHVFVSAAEADVSVEGRIEKRTGGASGFRALLTLRDGKGTTLGTRELVREEASCAAMNEPLALVIAVMIDPDAKLSSSPAPLPPAPPATASPVAAAAPVPAPATAAPLVLAPPPRESAEPTVTRREPWRFEGGAAASVVTGLAPAVDVGATLSGILFLPNGIPLGFRGYGSLFAPTTAEQDGARASFDLFYAGGAVCPTLRRTAFTAMLCFGGQLGLLRSHAETSGRRMAAQTTAAVWNAVSEARIILPIVKPLAFAAGVGGVLPLLRPSFDFTPSSGAGTAELHRVSLFGVSADVGLVLFFP